MSRLKVTGPAGRRAASGGVQAPRSAARANPIRIAGRRAGAESVSARWRRIYMEQFTTRPSSDGGASFRRPGFFFSCPAIRRPESVSGGTAVPSTPPLAAPEGRRLSNGAWKCAARSGDFPVPTLLSCFWRLIGGKRGGGTPSQVPPARRLEWRRSSARETRRSNGRAKHALSQSAPRKAPLRAPLPTWGFSLSGAARSWRSGPGRRGSTRGRRPRSPGRPG